MEDEDLSWSEEDDSSVEDAKAFIENWLRNNPSVEDAKAFIENHPDALMGIVNDDDYIVVPLHLAIYVRASDEVILLLLEACPEAAAAKDLSSGYNVLHLAIDGEDRDKMCSEEVIAALLNAHPGAASERHPDTGNLPLHDAVNKTAPEEIILLLRNAYPQAAAEVEDVEGDLDWLPKDPSVEDAKAFIENHPDALMGIEDREGDICVPLHTAIYDRASDEVILLLLEACPQAAAAKDVDGHLPLHSAIDTMCSEEVIAALLNAHPGAASEKKKWTKNLPLHDALINDASEGIILSLIKAYPQAAAEKTWGSGKFLFPGLLFERFLEVNASDDLMREICKVRIDGLLPLGVVLTKRSSDDIVLAVLEAYPEAAGKRFSTKFDECILPLHIAYEDKHSEKVQGALRRAYPDAEKENPFETTHQLHKFLENESLDIWAHVKVGNLIEKYPEAAGKRGRDGRLPLHIAIDRIAPCEVTIALFKAYPQAGKEKMKDGRLPIEMFAEQKVTDGWPQEFLTEMVTGLLENDMPVSIEDGTPVEHSGSWHACISYSTKTATRAVRIVLQDSKKMDDGSGRSLGSGFGKHIHALADACDYQGRTALGLASKESRELIYQYLLFCGRYKLQIGPPEYRTATSV
eukprot:scaffold14642_cov83-Skeletonema_dohrnii-CCMP3373.AAC.5